MGLLLTGCYEDFNPEIGTKPVLCVNSLITADEAIEVSLSHSWVYSDGGGNHEVDDATVAIYANGEIAGADYVAHEGDRIRIEADSKRYGKATGEVTVPHAVTPVNISHEATVTNRWEFEGDDEMETERCLMFNLNVELTIKDPATIANYYHLGYESFSGNSGDTSWPEGGYYAPEAPRVHFSTGSLNYESEPIFSEHIGVLDAVSGNDAYGFTFFTDRQFSGKSYTLHLQFTDMALWVTGDTVDEEWLDCGLQLRLSNVSASYYNWANYRWHADDGLTGDMGNIGLGDPIWGYSNVSTGAGVVAAQSGTTVIINLREFLEKEIGNL